ncbi:peptide-methionine (S)-S-oxide reductase [Balneicella halophila]|uniref:Peptide methionine sulfoxide reductase MsrA n=1 Tax=Balneicella halophila TaxID=1537566 RepID=A0A7L4USS3_BALHA|nr:peptide-methionine (S)-S-oxide reductase MsrA [Balneicella halophila]PVX52582.1 peptide-methionine (S)-S-oxide reductase [Balneicella halophila]
MSILKQITVLITTIFIGMIVEAKNAETATLGAGCFWCVEAVFDQLKGVESVQSGYSGGDIKNPAYKEVCTGRTGHAEVVQITFNPELITFEEILEVFWTVHDPTSLNRQGADVGTQYRSAIFYHSEKQKEVANEYIKQLHYDKVFDKPIVTEVVPFEAFYPAEDYHNDYYERNGDQPYCRMVIRPKVNKFKKQFKDKLKK